MMTFQQLFSRARNSNEVQDALNEFRRNPDWRQIAAFFLGLVFLSCLRHAWYAPFIREPLASVFSTLRGQGQDAEKGQAQLFMRAEFKRQKLRSANNLFAFMAFAALGMSSMTQFFSLLLFGPRSQVLCSISLGLGLGASVAARVIGLFALSIELKHRFEISRFELVVYWFLLLSALGVTGGTIFFTLGRLITVPNFGDLSICVKLHFLPTSLTASVTLIVLEIYTLFRILFGVTISHVVSDVSLRRLGALLLLDLAVVVPDAVPTNILGDFLPFSVASLVLLSAFGSRSTPQQPGHSKSASSDSSSSSSSSSPILATPPHMARIDQAGSSPTPSQRAFHNSLMGIPALGATMRNLRGMSGSAPPQLPPLQIQMPNGSMPVTKELPNLPTEHVLGSQEFRSDAATMSASPSQYSTSDDGAAMQRSGTTPSRTTQMPGSTPRSGKIMVSQVQFANQSERDQTSGLSPAPRAMQPARPRLFVDTARPDDLDSHLEMTTPDAHDMVRTAPEQLGFDPARSMVSPAMMATPGRRVSARTRSSVYSPQTIESAPAHRATYTSLPGDAHKRNSKRKSHAPTFGNRRSVRHPNVPVTPEEPPPVLDIGPLVNQFPAVFPAQWMARPVRPIRVARGPRERPRQMPYPSPNLPTSAPPVQPTSASSIRQPLSAPLMWKARSDQDKDEWHSVVAA